MFVELFGHKCEVVIPVVVLKFDVEKLTPPPYPYKRKLTIITIPSVPFSQKAIVIFQCVAFFFVSFDPVQC